MIPQFQTFCKSQLLKYFESKTTSICTNLGYPLYEVIQYLRNEFLDTNDICSIYQNCNQTQIEPPNDTCSKCKFIVKELKREFLRNFHHQGLQFDTLFGTFIPHTANFITFLCSDISMRCQNLDIEKIITELIIFEKGVDNFPDILCTKIDLCN